MTQIQLDVWWNGWKRCQSYEKFWAAIGRFWAPSAIWGVWNQLGPKLSVWVPFEALSLSLLLAYRPLTAWAHLAKFCSIFWRNFFLSFSHLKHNLLDPIYTLRNYGFVAELRETLEYNLGSQLFQVLNLGVNV